MVDEVRGPTPGDYRANAEKIRKLARAMRFDDSRRQLLDLAERFDRMAARVEERIAPSKPTHDQRRPEED